MAEPEKKPDLFVDDDWKAQAQAEKEKLAETVEPAAAGTGPGPELPPASFEGLVSDVAFQAMIHLGMVRDEKTGKGSPVNFVEARYHIDMLGVLKDKTKGNLDEEEAGRLGTLLDQLRMYFVQRTSKK
jgi:hypothetical protein